MEFGDKFKNARIDKGYSLNQIEEDTKIRKLYLEAIENENFSILPPRVYAVGFVRKYAKYLDLDEDQLAQEFKQAAYDNQIEEVELKQETVSEGLNLSTKNILAAVLFLVIAIGVGNFVLDFLSGDINDNQTPPPGIVNQPPAEEPNTKPEDISPPATPDNKVTKEGTLVIKANSDCWLQAKVDGETVFEAILPKGEEKVLKGQKFIYIKVGNAGGIDLAYNGQQLAPLGEGPQVVEKTFTIQDDNENNE